MKQFNEPEIIIKQLEVEDIITTSGDVHQYESPRKVTDLSGGFLYRDKGTVFCLIGLT